MIPVNEAIRRILNIISPSGVERVSLSEALHRVSGEEVRATRKIPPFDYSMRDGYAVRHEDVKEASADSPIRLREVGSLRAGYFSKKGVERGEAIRLMTGALIPDGADTVIPLEDTHKEGDFIYILKPVSHGDFIRKAGEEVRGGEQILAKGDLIRPFEIEILASQGHSTITVYQKPRVAILSIGDELADLDEPLDGVRIISSNLYAIAAQVMECGGIPIRLGIVKDQKEAIREKILEGMKADIFISSAGTSSGDYDFVKEVFGEIGAEMIFSQIAMKPGKSVAFWLWNGKPVFNLPGNPLASLISFEELVRPAILKMMGQRQLFRPVVEAILEGDVKKELGVRRFIFGLVSFKNGSFFVNPLSQKGLATRMSLKDANGLVVIPEDQDWLKAGEKVKVQLLQFNF